MASRAAVGWEVYSTATGFLADVVALAVSAAISEEVTVTLRAALVAAAILEAGYIGVIASLKWSTAGIRASSTPDEVPDSRLVTGLAALVFGACWIVAGVAVAAWLVPGFDISGFWGYIGTVVLVGGASWAVYSPLALLRKLRRTR